MSIIKIKCNEIISASGYADTTNSILNNTKNNISSIGNSVDPLIRQRANIGNRINNIVNNIGDIRNRVESIKSVCNNGANTYRSTDKALAHTAESLNNAAKITIGDSNVGKKFV